MAIIVVKSRLTSIYLFMVRLVGAGAYLGIMWAEVVHMMDRSAV